MCLLVVSSVVSFLLWNQELLAKWQYHFSVPSIWSSRNPYLGKANVISIYYWCVAYIILPDENGYQENIFLISQ